MGGSRKNAADIKMAVDAIEMAFERGFITTFAIGTGDSDFTPLVHKLRELDKRVIGIGVQSSTSALLPPACDEFLFYDRLPGVEPVRERARPARRTTTPTPAPIAPEVVPEPEAPTADGDADVGPLVARTLAGLQRHTDGPVLASRLKRAILRKDPTFDEAAHGFRSFTELLRHLAGQRVVELADVVADLGSPQLSGLKNQLRKRQPDFSEKRFGFGSFLSFVRAARAQGLLEMGWDDAAGDYRLHIED